MGETDRTGLRTLLVDDDPDDRALVLGELTREFPDLRAEHVVGVRSFAAALAAGAPDLVISEYRLRWTNGLAVLDAVKSRFPEAVVIMATASGNEEIAVAAMKAGLDDYVVKAPGQVGRLPALVRSRLQHVKLARAARQAEARYQYLFERVPIGLCRIAPDGTLLDANPAMLEILGRPAPWQPRGRDADGGSVSEESREPWHALLETRDIVDGYETEYRRPDGSVIWVRLSVRATRDDGGRILYYEAAVQDVTERKRVEEALRAESQFREAIIASAQDGIIVIDRAHRTVLWNPYMEELTGIPAHHVLGRHPLELFPVLRDIDIDGIADRALAGEVVSVPEVPYHLVRTGRSGWCWTRITPHRAANGEIIGVMGLVHDVTERKRAEEALVQAKETALESARLKSEFLANVSHEIRTPVQSIKGFTELALDTPLTPEQREYLEVVQSSTLILLRLLNDVLDFSRMERGQLRMEALPFDLRDLLAATVKAFAPDAQRKGVEVSAGVAPEVPADLVGDAARLGQVVTNLVGNAVKFTERGEVSLRAEMESAGEGEAVLHFSVADTGIGIPPDKHQAIFEAFVQADGSTTRRFGGTGLGLAITRKLVEAMAGRIWVESEAGRGATFHFTARFTVGSRVLAQQ
jgi:PAS domain S-box-containing protein